MQERAFVCGQVQKVKKVMKNYLSAHPSLVLFILGLISFISVIGIYGPNPDEIQRSGITTEFVASATNLTSEVSAPVETGVIVRDSGASFMMAPISKSNPTVVLEKDVRAMQKNATAGK